ncbi:polyprenyl synthetase family protein [Thalassobacter stenotrophicus]|jgi:farnesyl diphosphate synthase|uniref:Geranylgeranyl diphosphate synthase n=2 Tax=Thalassobacter stenotrophicus TaxID=266809 RepID=A0A0P1EXI9_9RHOB|nr:farnesyl diphosphate synthase [Thalassobacter stenotrophicus]PVZ49735.1 polyprenyl synthetase family protein [Thalassobacter stenotrophicus]CUH59825.1 Farnesyl diphosphate synthase [Thalassobacter stenotrophicus]SHI88373.1 farnesyl-diphosphate synthase [Thalassobacter stenotrophicus DSM 16310]
MFKQDLSAAQSALQGCLDEIMSALPSSEVMAGMRYASAGGKRLRGFLAMETARLFDVDPAHALRAGAAVECLHAYSLVHDDMPCMDDDALRRGQPTVHVKWDEATAVLVGDALQTLAFEILAHPDTHPDGAVRAQLCLTLARASGAEGMVLGQAQDIAAETASAPLTLDQITELQSNKTGALLVWPCEAGAILGGADPAPLVEYARALGLAFQIADDVLDVEGDAILAGKALQKDADAGKATFVSLLGLEAAKARAQSLIDEACAALQPYGPRADTLRDIARYVVTRDR